VTSQKFIYVTLYLDSHQMGKVLQHLTFSLDLSLKIFFRLFNSSA